MPTTWPWCTRTQPQQAPYTSTLYTDSFLTENSQVTQGQFLTATTTGASALANVQVQAAMGRMFDQATDVLAVAAQEADPANPQATFVVRNHL